MINKNNLNLSKQEKGVSLIITFFIMIIILTVVLSISVILYSEVKVIRNVSNSMASLYAAESGVEKVLYYDRQVLPLTIGDVCDASTPCVDVSYACDTTVGDVNFDKCVKPAATRGLCYMLSSSNTNSCKTGSSGETSIYCCNYSTPTPSCPTPADITGSDCGVDTCTNCSFSFATIFDDRTYKVTASVNNDHYLDVQSTGMFGTGQRKIDIKVPNP